MQDMALIANADGMSGVVAALIAGHTVVSFGKDIDNLPLTFVAPLDAYNCEVLFHYRFTTDVCRVLW